MYIMSVHTGDNHCLTSHATQPKKVNNTQTRYEIGDHVIVEFDSTFFLGEIKDALENCAELKVIIPSGPRYWKWPEKEDLLTYPWANVIQKLGPTLVKSHRGPYEVSETCFI